MKEAAGDPAKTWKLVKWVSNRETPYKAFTPFLKKPEGGIAFTREERAKCLSDSFFPSSPPADLADIEGTIYPDPIEFPQITEIEIRKAIKGASSKKAPGEDMIPNLILKKAIELLLSQLT